MIHARDSRPFYDVLNLADVVDVSIAYSIPPNVTSDA